MRSIAALPDVTPAEAMSRAEHLALRANPHPNPRVGAVVIASDGHPVGEGFHRAPGEAHAEAEALSIAGDRARAGTLYVTLEPCNHQGRTPPCTAAILRSGVQKVIMGALDPDSRVNGGGAERLRAAGVEVEVGLGAGEALDPAYFHHRRTGRALVTLKLAATLDGQTAAADGSSQWITSEAARSDAHRLRAAADAVVIGAGTLRADDPRLDVRLPGYDGPQPIPVVIAGSGVLPTQAQVWSRRAIVVSTASDDRFEDVLVVKADSTGRPDLHEALAGLAERGLLAVLVEGGPTLAAALLDQGLVDRGILYLGGLLAGGVGRPLFEGMFPTLSAARRITIERAISVGSDLRIDFHVHRNS